MDSDINTDTNNYDNEIILERSNNVTKIVDAKYAVAKLDKPMSPSGEGNYCFTCHLLGIDNEQLQKDRDEILSCDVDAIRALAPYIEAIIKENKIAALGNEDVISKEAGLFKEVRTLA